MEQFAVCVVYGLTSTDRNLLFLLGNVTYNISGSMKMKISLLSWGNSSNCNFILYMGYAILVSCVVLLWQTAVLVWKEYDRYVASV